MSSETISMHRGAAVFFRDILGRGGWYTNLGPAKILRAAALQESMDAVVGPFPKLDQRQPLPPVRPTDEKDIKGLLEWQTKQAQHQRDMQDFAAVVETFRASEKAWMEDKIEVSLNEGDRELLHAATEAIAKRGEIILNKYTRQAMQMAGFGAEGKA